MTEKEIQGSCISCKSQFAIPVSELQDDMTCPVCGSDANISVICPHCGQEIYTNGRTLSCSIPCPKCNKDFIWNTVKSTDGTPMVVSMTGRLEMHDMASLLGIMQENLEKAKSPSRSSPNVSNSHSIVKNREAGAKGCLGSIIVMISLGASFLAFTIFLLLN